MSSPSSEASDSDPVTILNDTPIAEALRQAREQAGLSVSTQRAHLEGSYSRV